MVLKINGDIVGNDWKEIYDWFGIECSTPGDVQKALAELPKGDRLQVKINSGGGEVMRCFSDCDGRTQYHIAGWNADDSLCISGLCVRKSSGYGKDGGDASNLR